MAKKSDRVIRREQNKASKQFQNQSRLKPKSVTSDSKMIPISQIITLDDLTKPDFDK
jgi:hypothetical protein